MKRYVFIAIMFLLFASCSHKVSDSVRSKSDTVALVHVRTDSVFLKDSVFVDRNTYVRGDTVYRIVSRVQYKDRWRTKIKTDTVYRSVRDTVYIREEKHPTQRFTIVKGSLLIVFVLFIFVLLLWLAPKIRKGS